MMRPVRLLFLCLVALTCVNSCRQYLPQNSFLQLRPVSAHSTSDARRSFDHAKHDGLFAKAGVTCLDCHRFDVLVEVPEPQASDLSRKALHAGGAACHSCHAAGETHMAGAPQECFTCHENLDAIKPADHDLSWDRVHAQMARVEPARCETCHRQTQCIDCHERRDDVRTRVHERNFRNFHGIVATANPMQCGSCHRQDFCIRCHEASRAN